jgi:hypothetical protein
MYCVAEAVVVDTQPQSTGALPAGNVAGTVLLLIAGIKTKVGLVGDERPIFALFRVKTSCYICCISNSCCK